MEHAPSLASGSCTDPQLRRHTGSGTTIWLLLTDDSSLVSLKTLRTIVPSSPAPSCRVLLSLPARLLSYAVFNKWPVKSNPQYASTQTVLYKTVDREEQKWIKLEKLEEKNQLVHSVPAWWCFRATMSAASEPKQLHLGWPASTHWEAERIHWP